MIANLFGLISDAVDPSTAWLQDVWAETLISEITALSHQPMRLQLLCAHAVRRQLGCAQLRRRLLPQVYSGIKSCTVYIDPHNFVGIETLRESVGYVRQLPCVRRVHLRIRRSRLHKTYTLFSRSTYSSAPDPTAPSIYSSLLNQRHLFVYSYC